MIESQSDRNGWTRRAFVQLGAPLLGLGLADFLRSDARIARGDEPLRAGDESQRAGGEATNDAKASRRCPRI